MTTFSSFDFEVDVWILWKKFVLFHKTCLHHDFILTMPRWPSASAVSVALVTIFSLEGTT